MGALDNVLGENEVSSENDEAGKGVTTNENDSNDVVEFEVSDNDVDNDSNDDASESNAESTTESTPKGRIRLISNLSSLKLD